MQVAPPPGMAQWVRQKDEQIRTLQREVAASASASDKQRYMAVADIGAGTVTSIEGQSSDWLRVDNARTPQVNVMSSTGRLLVTVSAMVEAIRDPNSTTSATAIMRHTLTPATTLLGTFVGDELVRGGLIKSFSYGSGQDGSLVECQSYATVIYVPDGRYSIGSEYLYYHYGDNIYIRWSHCSMTVEPI